MIINEKRKQEGRFGKFRVNGFVAFVLSVSLVLAGSFSIAAEPSYADDTFETARPYALGDLEVDYLDTESNDNTHMYRFTLDKKERILFYAFSEWSDPFITVYDSSRTELECKRINESLYGLGIDNDMFDYYQFFDLTLNPGTYYVELFYYDLVFHVSDCWYAFKGDAAYKVKFNGNGGSDGNAEYNWYTRSGDGKVGKLPSSTRSGYKFLGWYTAKTGGLKITSDTLIRKDTTFYAHWQPVGWKKQANGTWKYYQRNGKVATGWKQIAKNGKKYWYYFASKGTMYTGFKQIIKNGKKSRYYFGGANDGKMRTGWQTIKGKRYYFGGKNDGRMKTGRVKIGKKYYTFGSNGVLKK